MTAPIAKYVRAELKALAQPAKAEEMAAYMRTEMPFYGVQKPERLPVIREFKRQFAPHSLKVILRQYPGAMGGAVSRRKISGDKLCRVF
ncbi:MAG: DNA alkylation repair protein [Candidatus Obscuribacter sp.]|nr:DNA alkylation repair protein [Candidatus Obscuribacter sp.]